MVTRNSAVNPNPNRKPDQNVESILHRIKAPYHGLYGTFGQNFEMLGAGKLLMIYSLELLLKTYNLLIRLLLIDCVRLIGT